MPAVGRTRRIAYEPTLDGLRGVALLGVIGYHAGIEQLRGGFLGVSSFFTLSGFLITSLLLIEQADTGRIELGSFWARRLRRLLPAALVTITATVVLAALIADDSQLSRLRTDALASLFHFSNWRFIAEGDSYSALFQSPSFFRHFWSLAVEEQYYVVFPLASAVALRRFGGPTRRFLAVAGVLGTFALLWPAVLLHRGATTDRLYFGTDTRFGELLLGAFLALWWVRRDRTVSGSPVLSGAGIGAVAVIGWMWMTAEPSDDLLYRGGLALHAALTMVVILAAVAPAGPIRAVLAWEPVRRLGVVSYGAYLIHWPVLLWLQQDTALGPGARFAVGLALTLALAWLSHTFLEGPIRRLPASQVRRRAWIAIPASLTVAAIVLGVTAWQEPTTAPIDFAAADDVLDSVPAADSAPESAPDAVRLAAFGDSTALMTGIGMLHWAEAHPDEVTMVRGAAELGCGLVSGGSRRLEGRVVDVPEECDGWLAEWPTAIAGDVDLAVVQLGAWEIVDHQVEPGGPFLAVGRDEDYEARQLAQLDTAVSGLLDHSETVALILHPDVGQARLDTVPAGGVYPEYDPERSARWREMVAQYAATRPDVVVIDLAGWIAERPDDRLLRPDGVHFTAETTDVVAEWLVPEILRVDRELRGGPDEDLLPAPPASDREVRILLAGDSLAADIAPALRAALASAPEEVDFQFQVFPVIPREPSGMAEWNETLAAVEPDIVVMYVGWWESAAAATVVPVLGEPGFEAAYRDTVLAPWLDHLHRQGIETVYLAMAPVRPRPDGDTTSNDRIEAIVDAAEAEAGGRNDVHFVPSAEAVAPSGYVGVMNDPRTAESERVRRIDGVHLCPDGAERVVDLLLEEFGRLVDLHTTDAWRPGPWRTETPVDLALECPPVSSSAGG